MVTVSIKAGLAVHLMNEAWQLASLCKTIEEEEKDEDWKPPRYQENIGHAAAAVIMAAAALEASINETYLRTVDRNLSAFPKPDPNQVDLLAELWEIVESGRASPLRKHDVALRGVSRTPIARDADPGQSAGSLFKLRNLLVHFKPEWDHELDVHKKIEDRLRGRFEENQLSTGAPGSVLWFPSLCLGAGCAQWSCETVVAYHAEFTERFEIRQVLQDI